MTTTLSGCNHFAYRSYYIPLREVIDGVMCETYFDLEFSVQEKIAKTLERDVEDIKKKIEEQRQRAL